MGNRLWSSGNRKPTKPSKLKRKDSEAEIVSCPKQLAAEFPPRGMMPSLPGEIIWVRSASLDGFPIIALIFCCPCGCCHLHRVPVFTLIDSPAGKKTRRSPRYCTHPEWQWNGSLTRPTLSPGLKSESCLWAGFLIDGTFETNKPDGD